MSNGNVQVPDYVPNAVLQALDQVPTSMNRLKRQDFDLTNATAGERSKIASYQTDLPLQLRPDATLRLAFVVFEEFTTDGTADNTETFNLSHNLIETPNTTDFVLYEGGSRVSADAVDYANNTFDYTDDGTNNTLDVAYVFRDPVPIEIEKSAPRAQGNATEVVYDDVTSIVHERDQNQEPPEFDFDSVLGPIVPPRWTIDVFAVSDDSSDPAIAWDDSDTGTDNSITAINPVLSIPVRRSDQAIQGLSQAVKRDVIEG